MKTNRKIYLYGNKLSYNSVPNTKQNANIPTNIQIECKLCGKFVSEYLRIVDLFDVYDGIDRSKGYCCYNCVNGFKPNKTIALIGKDGKRYYPQLRSGLSLDSYATQTGDIRYGNVSDPTKSRIDEINKHRNKTKAYIKWCRKGGLLSKRRSKSNSKSKDNGIGGLMALANEIYKEQNNE